MRTRTISTSARAIAFATISIFVAVILTMPIASSAQNRAWTTTGSTGTVEEDDQGRVDLNNFVYGIKSGMTGTVRVRFNIVATEDIARFCPASQSMIKVRFRDSDGPGTNHHVKFDIRTTALATGGNTVIFSFDSNTAGFPASVSFQTATFTPPIDFDFVNNVYWIEAEVSRSDAAALVQLGSIQISESVGNPCP